MSASSIRGDAIGVNERTTLLSGLAETAGPKGDTVISSEPPLYTGDSVEDVDSSGSAGFSTEEDTRLRRLVNRNVLPVMCLSYLIQALDKGTLGTASIMGWMEDVGADSNSYGRTSTAFWIGVIIGEPIANQVIRKYSAARVLGISMFIWSGLVMCLAFTLNIQRVMLIRWLLGIFESCFGPCLLTLTTQYYTSSEQTAVITIYQSTFGVAGVMSYVLAFAFYHLQSRPWGLAGWQWMTAAIAVLSFVSSFVVFALLPVSPNTARWASKEDKESLATRTGLDHTQTTSPHFDRQQFHEAITDPIPWLLFVLIAIQCTICGGLGTFSGLIINRGLGFDVFTSQLLGMPLAFEIIVLYFLMAWLIRKTDQTLLCLISLTVPNILGTLLLIHTPPSISTRAYLMTAIYFMQAFGATGPSLTALVARNTAGTTKKSVSFAIVYTGWAVGNGVAPLLFREEWAPRYVPTLQMHLGLYVAWVVVALALREVLGRRRREKELGRVMPDEGVDVVGGDLTDRQDFKFQYSL